MKKIITFAICALALTISATNASATGLTVGGGFYLGSVDPGSPASETAEAGYINYLLGMTLNDTDIVPINGSSNRTYVRSGLACPTPAPCSSATDVGAQSTITGTGPTALDVTNFTYLLVKYGNVAYVWYVADLTSVSFASSFGTGGGLSHYALFNPSGVTIDPHSVPDGGTTAGLLGLAMLGIGYLRRRMA